MLGHAKPKVKLDAAPPRKRDWVIGRCYHVYQRGSRKQRVFETQAQLIGYLNHFDRLARRCQVRVHAFCLMSNHVHFLLEPKQKWGISQLMQQLQSHYARSVHQGMNVTGHLWRNHFHAKPIRSDAQYRATLLYIEQNPAAAGVARRAHRYEYSSAPAHTANDAVYRLNYKHHRATVQLYLDYWRKKFPDHQDWPARLRDPQEADFADIERVLGSDRTQPLNPKALPLCEPAAKAAGAHAATAAPANDS
ncbi:MAG: transposase [Bryobacteraceae bacterium]|nr:transposase [Bryobacteraceae bacterium]